MKPTKPWISWTLSLMLFLALFARDGRYQIVTTAASLLLFVVIVTRIERVRSLAVGALALYLVWATASASWSAFSGDSVRQVLNLMMWTSLGLALASLRSIPEICYVWARSARLAIVLALISASQLAGNGSAEGGVFNSKNHLGYAAAVSLIPIIALEWRDHRWRTTSWVVAAFMAAALANSQTGVSLVLVIPLLYMAVDLLRRTRGTSLRGLSLIGITAVGGAILVGFQLVLDQITGLLGRDSNLSGRDEIWAAVELAIRERVLFGTGLGGVWTRPEEEPTLAILLELPTFLRPATVYAHNGFLDAALQLGLIGALLLVFFVLRAFGRSTQRAMSSTEFVDVMPVVVVITYVVANMTETRLYNDQAWVTLVMAATVPFTSARRLGRQRLGSDDLALSATP